MLVQIISIPLVCYVAFGEAGNVYRNAPPLQQPYQPYSSFGRDAPQFGQSRGQPNGYRALEPAPMNPYKRLPNGYRAVEPAAMNPYGQYNQQSQPRYRDVDPAPINPPNPAAAEGFPSLQKPVSSPQLGQVSHSELFPEMPDIQLGGNAVRTQYHGQDVKGNYRFGYNTGDGAFRTEHRSEDGTVQGQYGYVGPEGKFYRFFYIADANGFRVSEEPFDLEAGGDNAGFSGGENVLNNRDPSPFERAGGFGGSNPQQYPSTTENNGNSGEPSLSSPGFTPSEDGKIKPDQPISRFEFTDNRPKGYFSYLFMHPVNPGVGPIQPYDAAAESAAAEVSVPTEKTTSAVVTTALPEITSEAGSTQAITTESEISTEDVTSSPILDVSSSTPEVMSTSEVTSQATPEMTSQAEPEEKLQATPEVTSQVTQEVTSQSTSEESAKTPELESSSVTEVSSTQEVTSSDATEVSDSRTTEERSTSSPEFNSTENSSISLETTAESSTTSPSQ